MPPEISTTVVGSSVSKPVDDTEMIPGPIIHMPVETLGTIFEWCVNRLDVKDRRNSAMSIQNAPLLLTRFSSHWKHVAYATPGLWTVIED